jgi:hypothetical protein
MPKIEFTATHLIVDRKRIRVSYCGPGNWIEGVDPTTIKIRPWVGKSHFPAEVRAALTIENNSNGGEDYFEADCIRLVAGHPLYAAVAAVAPK